MNIRSAFLLLCAMLAPAFSHAADYAQTIAASRAFITNQMAQYNIPGCSIVLVESQRVVWAEGFGLADLESQTPVTTNTVMMIGSISKFITTVMAAQLADDGALDLDAPVADALPEFSMLDRFSGQADAWTTRAMLNHHAGIPGDVFNGSFGFTAYWPEYIDWLLDYFQTADPLYPPNLVASYCNSGFNLVGEIVARHDGMDYADSAQSRVFAPLGMDYTSFYHDHPLVAANLATGYVNGYPVPTMIGNMAATGGAFSRPLDVARLIHMVLADGQANGSNFISPAILAEIGAPAPAPLDVDNFFQPGLGLDSVSDSSIAYAGRTWAKDGNTSTFSAFLEILPDRQLGVFVNLNASHVARYRIARSILREALLERDGLAPPPTPVVPESAATNLPYAQLQQLEGDYVTLTGVDRIVAHPEGFLSLISNAQSNPFETPFRPLANGRFFRLDQLGAQYAFTNVEGRALLLRYGTDGGERDEFVYDGYAEKIYAVRYAPPAISPAWSSRITSAWVADNLYHDDYFTFGAGKLPSFVLNEGNGILSIAGPSFAILEPVSNNLAFVAGLSARGDGAVRIATNAAGHELLWFGGYRCRNADDLPVLQNLAALSAASGPNDNALFRYAPASSNASVAFVLSDSAADAVVRIFDDDGRLVAMGDGSAEFTFDDDSEVFISIASATPVHFEIKAVDVTYLRQAMRQTLSLYPRVPGFMVAVQEPGFAPIVVAEGYALRNPPSAGVSRDLTGDEHFRIESISKFYTATAIMLLRDRGLLSLTDTVADLAPELNAPRADELTVELLLAHRSGMPDANNSPWINNPFQNDPFREFTFEEIVAVAAHLYPNLLFEPDTDYHYTDTGYNILARIVENVSGTNYQAFMHSQLFEPLGLAQTKVPYNDEYDLPEPSMHSYATVKGVYGDWSRFCPSAEHGCGSVMATIRDLMAFTRAVLATTNVLSDESRALMMEPLSQTGADAFAGRGAMLRQGLGWGHGGNAWGLNSYVAVDTNSGIAVAAANNGMEYDDTLRLFNSVFALYGGMGIARNMLGLDAGLYGMQPPLVLDTHPSARQNAEQNVSILCGNFPAHWTAMGLPDGLVLDPATGVISGSTDLLGTHEIELVAHNAFGVTTNALTFTVRTGFTNTIAIVSNAIVAAMAEEGAVGASIALVDDQEIVWAQGFGWEDREAGIPVTTNTVFHIGSVSKAFTAALALQYAERGLLDLDAPFTNTIPDVTWKERFAAARPITTLDLLSHHSGLPGDLFRAGFLTKPLGRGYLETTHDLAQTYPVTEPGMLNNYCNVGFVLLEGITEAAAAAEGDSRPFDQLANARLFDMLDMSSTSYRFDKPAISNHLAVPYFVEQRMPPEYVEIYGTGSMYSHPVDMAQFMKALFSDNPLVLRPETRDLMLSDHSTNALFDAFTSIKTGLGWDTVADTRLSYAGPSVWKNGGTLAYSAQLHFLPEKKLGVAITVSSSSGIIMTADALALQHALLERDGLHWPTNSIVFPTNEAPIDQSALDALAGVYVGSEGYHIVESQPGSLTFRNSEHFTLRTNGWFMSDAIPGTMIAFTNAHGRDIVLFRQASGAYENRGILSERFTPSAIPAAWSNRLETTWLARNVPADSYMKEVGIGASLVFRQSNGILYVETSGVAPTRALDPVSDNLAFLPGLVNRGDSAVQIVDVDGVEHVLYAGYFFGPAPSEIPLAHSIAGTISTERFARWYEIQPAPPPTPVGGVNDIFYQLTLSGAPTNFLLRLYQADGVTPVAERMANGPLDLVSDTTPLLLCIQPASSGAQTGAYQIDFAIPVLIREIAIGETNVSLVWQGPTGTPVAVQSATHLTSTNTFSTLFSNVGGTNSLTRQPIPMQDTPARFFRITTP